MRRGRALIPLLLVAACGGTSVAEVLGGGGGAATNDGGTTASLDATTGADAAGSNDGGNPDKTDGGSGADGSTADALPPKDAGPRASDLSCPPTTNAACDMDHEKCCRMNTTSAYTCIPAASPCLGVEIRCANQADCDYRFPGNDEVCCAQVDSNLRASSVLCKAISDCDPNFSRVIICDPSESEPCPHGGECTQSQEMLPKFYFCKP